MNAQKVLDESPVELDLTQVNKPKSEFHLRTTILTGLFACAGFAGAASWGMLHAQPGIPYSPVVKSAGNHQEIPGKDVKLHLSYQLKQVSEAVRDSDAGSSEAIRSEAISSEAAVSKTATKIALVAAMPKSARE